MALLATVTTLILTVIGSAPPASAAPPDGSDWPDAELVGGPTTGLLHDQKVDLLLHGVTNPSGVDLNQCGGPLFRDCAGPGLVNINRHALSERIDDDTIAFSLLVGRRFTSMDGEVDCLVTVCTVRAVDDDGDTIDELPLTFAAEGTLPSQTPTLRVGPTTEVWNGRELAVEGEGFSPFFHSDTADLAVMQVCRGGADPDPATDCMTGMPNDDGLEDWLLKKGSNVAVRGYTRSPEDPVFDGVIDGEVYLWRYLDLPSGWFDCAPAACTFALVQDGGRVATERVPLTFGPEWRPWASPEEAVDMTVGRILRRPLGPSARAAMVAALDAGTTTVRDLVFEAVEDPSVDGTVGEVLRQYVSHLGRFPEPDGYAYWIGRVEAGLTPDRLARIFAATPEATARYAGQSIPEIVETVYRATLGRAPDAAGAAFWTGKLEAGLPIWKLVFHFARSAELRARTADQAARAAAELAWFDETPALVDWPLDPIQYVHFLLWFH